MRTGELGFWWHSLGGPPAGARAAAGPARGRRGDRRRRLHRAVDAPTTSSAPQPSLRIAVLERERRRLRRLGPQRRLGVGVLLRAPRRYEQRSGAAALRRRCSGRCSPPSMRWRAFLREHGDRRRLVKSGQLGGGARPRPGWRACARQLAAARARGLGEEDLRELVGGGAAASGCACRGARRRSFTPHVARVHPAKLLRGLARRRRGARAWRSTSTRRCCAIAPRAAAHPAGTVRARWVVRATEGYTAIAARAGAARWCR